MLAKLLKKIGICKFSSENVSKIYIFNEKWRKSSSIDNENRGYGSGKRVDEGEASTRRLEYEEEKIDENPPTRRGNAKKKGGDRTEINEGRGCRGGRQRGKYLQNAWHCHRRYCGRDN